MEVLNLDLKRKKKKNETPMFNHYAIAMPMASGRVQ